MPEGNDWFLLVWALVCIAVVLGMSYWVTRMVAGKRAFFGGAKRRGGGQMEVLAQELLGKDQRLAVVRVGERYFLLGITPHAISMLSEVSRDEALSSEEASGQAAQNDPKFFDALSGALKERMRR